MKFKITIDAWTNREGPEWPVGHQQVQSILTGSEALYAANTTYFVPVDDCFVLGVLIRGPLGSHTLTHHHSRAGRRLHYRLFSQFMERFRFPTYRTRQRSDP